ncbi:hypothetical protein [Pseudomonas sp. RIT-PI-AD]|uniref:hypothetical protein n=1 Tax=Pseudomonas sp. RIT-PI-AD TaxID=3035294 RepID=UPI0021D95530|nr:hypothetical protein [Pseudomonas sp. RIT-PI-AD]
MDEHDELRSRDYPVNEDMPFQRKIWAFERIGWYGLCLMVLLTLAGLFSRGPLSWAAVEVKGGAARLEYDRFMRNGANTTFTLDVRQLGASHNVVTLTGEALDVLALDSIQPQPESMRSEVDGLELTFKADANGHTRANLSLRPDGVGLLKARLGANGQTAPFWVFIYP